MYMYMTCTVLVHCTFVVDLHTVYTVPVCIHCIAATVCTDGHGDYPFWPTFYRYLEELGGPPRVKSSMTMAGLVVLGVTPL